MLVKCIESNMEIRKEDIGAVIQVPSPLDIAISDDRIWFKCQFKVSNLEVFVYIFMK